MRNPIKVLTGIGAKAVLSLSFVAFLAAGCASAPNDDAETDQALASRYQIQLALPDVDASACDGTDPTAAKYYSRFKLYVNNSERTDGHVAARCVNAAEQTSGWMDATKRRTGKFPVLDIDIDPALWTTTKVTFATETLSPDVPITGNRVIVTDNAGFSALRAVHYYANRFDVIELVNREVAPASAR